MRDVIESFVHEILHSIVDFLDLSYFDAESGRNAYWEGWKVNCQLRS